MSHTCRFVLLFAVVSTMALGCASPYYADRGALLGGLGGAGAGALVGNAVGSPGAGALIGAGVGALSGAAIGSGLDDIDARNRAQIAAQLGRPLPLGTVTLPDVIAMSKAGVNDELIANHIRANGVAAPLQTGDLIALQNAGVSNRVIAALQAPQVAGQAVGGPPLVGAAPYYYPPPYYYPAPGYYYPPPYYNVGVGYGWGWRPRPRVGWGVSVGGPL